MGKFSEKSQNKLAILQECHKLHKLVKFVRSLKSEQFMQMIEYVYKPFDGG